ncbi:MAG: leucyl aminopeptidase, partial [Myxococcales bacterium]|nr:leucyl aminopeptidase [Myxococcales bacterium]
GGAAVLGAARAVAELAPKGVEVHFIVPTAENMVSDRAYRVNDVIQSRLGKTVEIRNTDAEGRLILADALAYAVELEPEFIVDYATLTGGAVMTFAMEYAAVLSNRQELGRQYAELGTLAGESMWQLPLSSKLRPSIDSDVADIRNVGGQYGSTIVGGLFLAEFVGDIPWVHVDIAGLEMSEKPKGMFPKGATGYGVLSLVALCERAAELNFEALA